MRIVLIALAVAVAVYAFVTGRRATRLAAKNAKRHDRVRKVEKAAKQKPGQIKVPKTPKVKRS